VSHSIFTQKFKAEGDQYPRVLEMPTFGHSNNHVGIQIADLLASALLYPMATCAYCRGHVSNVHVDANAGHLLPGTVRGSGRCSIATTTMPAFAEVA
jgi:hypothetical protein